MASNKSVITITSVKGEKIVLTSTNTKIKFDTLDDEKVLNKSKSVSATVIITGKIKDTDTSELKKVFNWSKTNNPDENNRKLVIEYTIGKVIRSYEFSEMFVLNYEEYLTEAGTDSQYTLILRQKEKCLDDIKTY